MRNVAVLVGSLRKDSLNRKVARAAAAIAADSLNLEIVEYGRLSIYNPDEEGASPAAWTEFRQRIRAANALLFVTPEYNRSVPGGLKNAIDVGSRPHGQSAWDGKPGAVISASPGAIGGFGANHHLRQMLVYLNVPTMPQPELYVGKADGLFDAEGKLTNDEMRKRLAAFLQAFAGWIESNSKT